MTIEEKIKEIIKEHGLYQDHENCDSSCTKKYWEEKAEEELTDDILSLITKEKSEAVREFVRDYMLTYKQMFSGLGMLEIAEIYIKKKYSTQQTKEEKSPQVMRSSGINLNDEIVEEKQNED